MKGIEAQPVDILLVEDNSEDAMLMIEAVKRVGIRSRIQWVCDGVEAIDYLRNQPPYEQARRPHLILLDWHLPRVGGDEVLAAVKSDPVLHLTPVVVMTSSQDDHDIAQAYGLHANCYIVKPYGFAEMLDIVRRLEEFWLSVVQLPPPERSAAR